MIIGTIEYWTKLDVPGRRKIALDRLCIAEALTDMRFYTLEEIARELHIAPATARNRLTLGQPMPPSIRIGRRRLFPADEYEKWIASQLARSDDFDETSHHPAQSTRS